MSLPVKTDWMKIQMEHSPSRSYAEEIIAIVSQTNYKNALEIGCIWGISTLAILTSGEGKLTSVDPIPQTHPDMHAQREVEANNLLDRWRFVNQRSEDFWGNTESYDLIYIDGSHLYTDFRNDIFEAWKVLDDGGLLFCDDITHKANRYGEYGVSLAAWEFVKEHHIETIKTTTRLLIIKK